MNLLYTVVHFASTPEGEAEAVVQMRGGIYLDTSEGLMRLTPAQKIKLPYSQIKTILDTEGDVLYFVADADRTTFMMLYPEYETWNL